MNNRIIGTTMPVLEVSLDPGESLIAESGELSWMNLSVQMRTGLQVGQQHGVMNFIKRTLGGGSMFMTEYTAVGGQGLIAFASKIPGSIMELAIDYGQSYLLHRHGLVCSQPGVELSLGFQQSLGAGAFGGDGFVLQKLAGQGTAFVSLSGEIAVYDLGAGEGMRVLPGHVGMFQDSVQFGITTVPGIVNELFGGDGLFLAELVGPGRVWLQSMTLPQLAAALAPYMSRAGEPGYQPDQGPTAPVTAGEALGVLAVGAVAVGAYELIEHGREEQNHWNNQDWQPQAPYQTAEDQGFAIPDLSPGGSELSSQPAGGYSSPDSSGGPSITSDD